MVSVRWGGLRQEPYKPDATDADNDGIVQEGTVFERPVGTRLLNSAGEELVDGFAGIAAADLSDYTLVDRDGKPVSYKQSWAQETLSVGDQFGRIGDRLGTLKDMGTLGETVGAIESSDDKAPKSIAAELASKPINDVVNTVSSLSDDALNGLDSDEQREILALLRPSGGPPSRAQQRQFDRVQAAIRAGEDAATSEPSIPEADADVVPRIGPSQSQGLPRISFFESPPVPTNEEENAAITSAKNRAIMDKLLNSSAKKKLTGFWSRGKMSHEERREAAIEQFGTENGIVTAIRSDERVREEFKRQTDSYIDSLTVLRQQYQEILDANVDNPTFDGYPGGRTREESEAVVAQIDQIIEYVESNDIDKIMEDTIAIQREIVDDEDTSVRLNMKYDILERFLDSGGKYKTTHDVDVTTASSDAGGRARYEQMAYGISFLSEDADEVLDVRPASGYIVNGEKERLIIARITERDRNRGVDVDSPDYDPRSDPSYWDNTSGNISGPYGGVVFVMREEVKERTKFCSGDSLTDNLDAAPMVDPTDEDLLAQVVGGNDSPGVKQAIFALVTGRRDHIGGKSRADDILPAATDGRIQNDHYMESLIFGTFDLTDVDTVRIKEVLGDGVNPEYYFTDTWEQPKFLAELTAGVSNNPRLAEIVSPEDIEMIQRILKEGTTAKREELVQLMKDFSVQQRLTAIRQQKRIEETAAKIHSLNPNVKVLIGGKLVPVGSSGGAEAEYLQISESWSGIAERLTAINSTVSVGDRVAEIAAREPVDNSDEFY